MQYICRSVQPVAGEKSPPLRVETLLLSCTLRAWRSVPLWTATITSMAELELELTQTQMAQKPMLRAEVGMRVRCANKASAE